MRVMYDEGIIACAVDGIGESSGGASEISACYLNAESVGAEIVLGVVSAFELESIILAAFDTACVVGDILALG